MADGRGDGPFSDPGKLEALFGELGPEPVELLLAVDSIENEKIEHKKLLLMQFSSELNVYRFYR